MTTRAWPAGRATPASSRPVPGAGANAAYALVGDVASKLGAVLATVLAARVLHVGDFATLGVCLAVVTVLTAMLDGGVATFLTREGAATPGARGPLLTRSLRERIPLFAGVLALAAALGLVVGPTGPWMWTAAGSVIGALTLTLLGIVRSAQDLATEAELRILGAVVTLGVVVMALASLPTATGVLAALAIGGAVVVAPLAWRVGTMLDGGGTWRPGPQVLRAALPLGALAIATIAYYRAPTLLLGALGSDLETARITVATTIAFGLLAVPNAITTGLLPRLAARTDADERREEARRALRWALLATGTLAITLAAVAPWVVPAVFGSRYGSVGPLMILLVAVVVIGVNGVLGTLLVAERRHRPLARQVGASLAVNIALAAALTPVYGDWGAAVATLVAELVALAMLVPECRGVIVIRRSSQRGVLLAAVAAAAGVATAAIHGGPRLALGAVGLAALGALVPTVLRALGASALAAATRLGVLRAGVLGLLAALGAFASWATLTGYGLRVTSDAPSFLAIVRQLADQPFESLSPFLATEDVRHSHVTPYTQTLGLVWGALAERTPGGNAFPDAVGLYRFLAAAGVVVAALFFHALFLWVRRYAGSAAAWRAIPVILLLFGPAEVIWAGDLSFHGFMYGPYMPQTLAMALLLYTLVLLDGPRSPARVVAATIAAGATMCVHPFTGALLCALATVVGMVAAIRRQEGWGTAPAALVGGFALASLWPAYSIDVALAETGLRGRTLIVLCVLACVAARVLSGALARPLAGVERLAARLDRPVVARVMVAAGLAAVVAIATAQVIQFLAPRNDPVIKANRLALYWVEDRWRWLFMLLAGGVGIVAIARLAGRGRLLPAVWLAAALGLGVAGAAGMPIPVWWRFILFAQVPLALGAAVWIAASRRGWLRRIVVGTLAASLVFRVVTLVALPPQITYLDTKLQPAYHLGKLMKRTAGIVATDPFTSYYVPAASRHRVLTVTKAHVGSRAELEVSQEGYRLLHEFAAGEDWWAAAQEMYRRGVRWVIIEKHTLLTAPTLEQFSTGPTPVVRTPSERSALGTYFYRAGRVGLLTHDDPSYAVYRLRTKRLGFA